MLIRTVLVIDDDQLQCDIISQYFESQSLRILMAHTCSDGIRICAEMKVDVVLLDQKLPDGNGVDLCKAILKHNDQTKILFITAYPSISNAIEAIKQGAFDYLSKPFELEELDLALDRALATLDYETLQLVQTYKSGKEKEFSVNIGRQAGLAEVWRMSEMAAASDAPVLITGETGVGKNVVAKCIHYRSPMQNKAFISINCAAIPENLVESELFGHEKGAFTGAVDVKKGLFEMAEGGTLFLDELGTLPMHIQSKLLGILDEKKLRRIGGKSIRPVNVRIITATNVNVETAVKEGTFREDLYYRINVIPIHVPPLRERLQDIPGLCRMFIADFTNDCSLTIPDSEFDLMMAYPWPGNVRELRNIIERSIILGNGPELRPTELLRGVGRNVIPREDETGQSGEILTLKELEINHIVQTLKRLSGNHSQTAKALGISRSTLKRKIKQYEIY